jgi:hypothetical protein
MPRQHVKQLAKQFGYELIRQSKHLIWQHCQTGAIVTTSKSPSDYRAIRNIEKDFAYGAIA